MTTRFPAAVRGAIGGPSATLLETVPQGMSGGQVYRCRHPSGLNLAVKRWPPGTSTARVVEAHQVMASARQAGCHIVPAVHTVGNLGSAFREGDEVWDVVEWMPGQPLPDDASPDDVAAGAAAIAEFHRSVRPLAERVEIPLAVRSRQERLSQLRDLVPRLQFLPAPSGSSYDVPSHDAPSRNAPTRARELSCEPLLRSGESSMTPDRSLLDKALRDGRESLLRCWDEISVRIGTFLRSAREIPRPVQYVLRDVHRDHLLFVDGAASGLIDFDAVRVDTPATDLARWVSRFLVPKPRSDDDRGWIDVERQRGGEGIAAVGRYHEVWNAGVAGYRQVSPFPESDARFAREILFATAWMSLANWSVWLGLQRRRFPVGPDVLAERLDELVRTVRLLGSRGLTEPDTS